MTVTEIARDFTALCAAGKGPEAGEKYWADDVVSIEAMDGPMAEVRGKAAVHGKGQWWYGAHESTVPRPLAPMSTVIVSRSASTST